MKTNFTKEHPFLTKDKIYYFENYQRNSHIIVLNSDPEKPVHRYYKNKEITESGYSFDFWINNKNLGVLRISFNQVRKFFTKGIIPTKNEKQPKWKKIWRDL